MSPDRTKVEEPRGTRIFNAGLSYRWSAGVNALDHDDTRLWLDDLEGTHGFRYFKDPAHPYARLYRHLYVEQLLAESTLEEQSEKLADWIIDTFTLLAENPPPRRLVPDDK